MNKTVLTEDGIVVEVRPVPPYVHAAIRSGLPEPPFPSVTLESKTTGNKEVVPALPGSPEYDDYRKAVVENQRLVRTAMTSFNVDYGVVRWKFPDTEEWLDDAPPDWAPPSGGLFDLLGVNEISEYNTRRSLYIRYELLVTDPDVERVDQIIYSKHALTKEEILAALVPFDSDDEIDLWSLRKPTSV